MIKRLATKKINNAICQLYKYIMTYEKESAQIKQETITKKPYQILFSSSFQNLIKSPKQGVLKLLRSRGITKIMASNHNIYETDQILLAHVECLYALIHRIEPSIDAISMFTQKVFKEIENMKQKDIHSASLLNLLRPSIITKITKISQSIDAYYNQTFRGMVSALIIILLQKSARNEIEYKTRLEELNENKRLVEKGQKQILNDRGQVVKADNIVSWYRQQFKFLNDNYRYVNQIDYWTGFQFVINMDYYTEDFLLNNIARLEKSLQKDLKDLKNIGIGQLLIKLKCINDLHKFKKLKKVGEKGLKTLFLSYNKLIEQYFKLLSNETNIFEIMHSDELIIQTQLLTDFLSSENYIKAKKVYLQIFKTALNISRNGSLLIDIKRLRGLLQIILILYTHEDTKDIHDILAQFEKIMMLYPLEKIEMLEIHCLISQKFGYKSDYFAQKWLKNLLQQKQKLERNRGNIHHIHQVTRQIFLAKKFMIYSKIASKPSKDQLQFAGKLANQLFNANVWFIISERDYSEIFLLSSSFSHNIYFQKSGIQNLTSSSYQRKKINELINHLKIMNINKNYNGILQQLRGANNYMRYIIKTQHLSHWRHNSHSRVNMLLQLANFNYQYLKKINPQEANNFIQQFLSKTLGVPIFYNVLKQKFAYPDLLNNFIQLMDNINAKKYSIQIRDLEAIKRLYHAQLLNHLKTTQKPLFSCLYQEHLEFIQLNRLTIPFNQEVYGLPSIGNTAVLSLIFQAMKRFQKRKQYIRMQIETYIKFNKSEQTSVETNYFEFPHLGDVKIKNKHDVTIILFRSYQGEPNHFINYKQIDMQKESQSYWIKKGFTVYIVKCQKDVEQFMKKITKIQSKIQK